MHIRLLPRTDNQQGGWKTQQRPWKEPNPKKGLCPLPQVTPREVAKPQSDMYYRLNLVHKHILYSKHSIFKQFDF